MKSNRDLDIIMGRDVLGHGVFYEKSGAIRERLDTGQTRPLRSYSLDISAAWEVVAKLGISLIPVSGGYFALVGRPDGWETPAAFLQYLQAADFATAGAAVGPDAPMTICLAALRALERRQAEPETSAFEPSAEPVSDSDLPTSLN